MATSYREYDLTGGDTEPKRMDNLQVLTGDGNIRGIFYHSSTLDLANAADAATVASDVTVTGVALGDIVMGASLGVDVADLTLDAQVTAADTVTVSVNNNTGGAVNLASTTVRLLVADVT